MSAVRYKRLDFSSHDREKVSLAWYELLDDLAHKDKVPFNVNEGHRTMERQRELVREKGLWSPSNPTGAANPSPTAPHIRTGNPAHAIDFDNAAAVVTAAGRRGVKLSRPIGAEPWHVDPDRASLTAYAQKQREKARRDKDKPVGTVSREGVELVASFEGFRSEPYRDAVGVWTIGYGHTKGVGPNTGPWSKTHARQVLRHELNEVYAEPVRALRLPLTQPMFDALSSFVYNLGPGAIGSDTGIGRALRERKWRLAADEMLRWTKAGGRELEGLVRRRKAERKLFLSGGKGGK